MPYIVKRSGDGFKACKKDGSKCFSTHPMTKDMANRQLRALYANEKKAK